MKKPQVIISEHEDFRPMKMGIWHKIYDKFISITCFYKTICIIFNLIQLLIFTFLNLYYEMSDKKICILFFGCFVPIHFAFICVMIETYKIYLIETTDTKNHNIILLLSFILLIFYYLIIFLGIKNI